MHGELFSLLGTPLPSYFVLMLVGFVFATTMGALCVKRWGQNPDVIVDLGLAMVLAGIIGARLLHVVADGHFTDYVNLCVAPAKVDWPISKEECTSGLPQASCAFDAAPDGAVGVWDDAKGVCHPSGPDCLAWAKFWSGGLTFYGGFIAATWGAWWLFKRDRFPFWKGCDMGGMMVPIGLGFGRLGCFLAGCCFGKPTQLPWGIAFPGFSPASEAQVSAGLLAQKHLPSLPVHPTQLYEAVSAFAISAIGVLFVQGRKRYDGAVFAAFLAMYGVIRFLLEFLRDDERGGFWGLSTSQWIGLCMLAAALTIHRQRSKTGLIEPMKPNSAGPSAAAA
ncbi:MAG TPA: prolipoprotein diacylglyceryl transferase [Polyangiaceae bacterium]|nr:prolipoprotein diacylglyceryl transferase [Polyangiaceae bacterium]